MKLLKLIILNLLSAYKSIITVSPSHPFISHVSFSCFSVSEHLMGLSISVCHVFCHIVGELLEQFFDNIVATLTLGCIIATVTLDAIVTFDSIFTFFIPFVVLLTSSPVI
jgi:hypothetical protein